MTFAHAPGLGGESAEGAVNQPSVGVVFGPIRTMLDDQAIWDYVTAVGDERYWAFEAALRLGGHNRVAPLTIFDRDVAIRLVGTSSGFGMQARQEMRFHRPLVVGREYEITGEIVDVSERRGIGYFATRAAFAPADDPQNVYLETINTRAYRFPGNEYGGRDRPPRLLSEWLASVGGSTRTSFPDVGAIVEGRTSLIDQARINIYSGPEANIHTNEVLARRAGLPATIAQGLMATELEGELYRDLFGVAFYRSGQLAANYVAPIVRDDRIRAVCVVSERSGDTVGMRSAVATSRGHLVTVGSAAVTLA